MKGTPQARQDLERLLRKLIAGYSPQQVFLFGSHAYGDPFAVEILEKGEVLYDAERVQAAQQIWGLNELGRERVSVQRVAQKPGF